MCLLVLVLLSLPTSSMTLISHYTYNIPATNNILNIYVIENYKNIPLKIDVIFNLTYVAICIFNNSKLNITYTNNSILQKPLISVSNNKTLIEVTYLFASNMTLIISSQSQMVKIIGNVSYINESVVSLPSYIDSSNSSNDYNLAYTVYILILIISVIMFIILRRYKGH
ncbi:hypothetical protein SJAV_13830 [Sulfurisphaera javensis]|uniref:Uncharacterized protein n=1 Tax=Sulfurisphaera javensis TaxID=2049879 RepID=A0AAT9GRW3_9CREN